ncbi:hypothetical protein BR93DRAFT_815181 [Coniochaeta sp. PMI_546]|nr:hypothetical protein BR93DRAFT_815181 [Coniochaeta sp. PMI_546]
MNIKPMSNTSSDGRPLSVPCHCNSNVPSIAKGWRRDNAARVLASFFTHSVAGLLHQAVELYQSTLSQRFASTVPISNRNSGSHGHCVIVLNKTKELIHLRQLLLRRHPPRASASRRCVRDLVATTAGKCVTSPCRVLGIVSASLRVHLLKRWWW